MYCLFIKFSSGLQGYIFIPAHFYLEQNHLVLLQGRLLLNRTRYNGICNSRNIAGTLRAWPLWIQYLEIPCTKQVEWNLCTCMTTCICKKNFFKSLTRAGEFVAKTQFVTSYIVASGLIRQAIPCSTVIERGTEPKLLRSFRAQFASSVSNTETLQQVLFLYSTDMSRAWWR